MDIVLIALKKLGAWTLPVSIIIIFVWRLLVWHQRFVAFTEDFEGTLRKVNMATLCNEWEKVVILLNGRYESYMSKMQIFDEEQRDFIRHEICEILRDCISKDKIKIRKDIIMLRTGYNYYCNRPFRQILRCPVEFIKTLFFVNGIDKTTDQTKEE